VFEHCVLQHNALVSVVQHLDDVCKELSRSDESQAADYWHHPKAGEGDDEEACCTDPTSPIGCTQKISTSKLLDAFLPKSCPCLQGTLAGGDRLRTPS